LNHHILFHSRESFFCRPLVDLLGSADYSLTVAPESLLQYAQKDEAELRSWHFAKPVNTGAIANTESGRILNAIAAGFKSPRVVSAFNSRLGNFLPQVGEAFFQRFQKLAADQIEAIQTLQHLHSIDPISLLVVTSTQAHTEQALVRFARQLRIPSLLIDNFDYLNCSQQNYGVATLTDKVSTVSDATKQELQVLGWPGKRISVDGSLVMQPKGGKTNNILFLAESIDFEYQDFMKKANALTSFNQAVAQAERQFSSERRIHILLPGPNFERTGAEKNGFEKSVESYKKWTGKSAPANISVVQQIDEAIFNGLAAVVAFGTNQLVPQFLAAEIPVVLLNWQKLALPANVDSKLTLVSKAQEIEPALNSIFTRESKQRTPVDNRFAEEKILACIKTLINEPIPEDLTQDNCIKDPVLSKLYEVISQPVPTI